jgi:hypothetical protein
MQLDDFPLELEPIRGAVKAWHGDVDADAWRASCVQARDRGGRLIALWASDRSAHDDRDGSEGGDAMRGGGDAMRDGGDGDHRAANDTGGRFAIHAVLAVQSSLVWLTHSPGAETYPDLSDLFPAANRMQRAAFDYFAQSVDPRNGLVPDTSRENSPVSIAVVGFALSAYPVGVRRGWMSRADALRHSLAVLRFFRDSDQSGPAQTRRQQQQDLPGA